MSGQLRSCAVARLALDARLGLDEPARRRALATLRAAAPGADTTAIVGDAPPFAELLAEGADLVVALTADPAWLPELGRLAAPLVWDAAPLADGGVARLLGDPAGAQALRRALAATDATIGLDRAARLAIEDRWALWLGLDDLPAAMRYLAARTGVVVGEGLGNMIYAGAMLRWVAERLGAPIDLIVHDSFDAATALFAEAPWLAAVHPGWEYLEGRRYRRLVTTVTASALEPGVETDALLRLNRVHHYNAEGRFIHEELLNFLGLEALFPDRPRDWSALPEPFIRDGARWRPEPRVIGVGNGMKPGAWVKRAWPGIFALSDRLRAAGYVVRSFGVPGEAVPGAEDFTGLPMRETVEQIGRCAAFVAHDGGIAHIAEAIGVPTLWLFGPTGIVKNGPVRRHSRALSALLPCSPCLYKSDWRDCAHAACMEAISVDQAWAALREMLAASAREGRGGLARRTADPAMLRFELGAPERPGHPAGAAAEAARRRGLYPDDAATQLRVAVRLMLAGDLDGARRGAAAAAARWPEAPLARFLRALLVFAHPLGPREPGDPDRPSPPPLPDHAAIAVLAQACVAHGLDLDETRAVFEAVTGLLADAGAPPSALAAAAAAFRAAPDMPENRLFLFERVIAHARDPEAAALDRAATPESAPAALRGVARMRLLAEGPSETALAPLRATAVADLDASAARVALDLGATRLVIPRLGAVALLVRHVAVRKQAIGSLSALLARQCDGLVGLGLRPIVITLGFDDLPEAGRLRHGVGFLQARADWSAEAWARTFDALAPAAVLAIDGAAEGLALPAEIAAAAIPLGAPGLADRRGLRAMFNMSCRLETRLDAPGAGETLDALTRALGLHRAPNARFAASNPRRALRALVAAPDVRDAGAFLHVVRAAPSIRFTVISEHVPRGFEPNVEVLPVPQTDFAALRAEADLYVDFSTRPGVMPAEALAQAAAGGALVSAAPLAAETPGAVVRPGDPADPLEWVAALDRAEALVRGEIGVGEEAPQAGTNIASAPSCAACA